MNNPNSRRHSDSPIPMRSRSVSLPVSGRNGYVRSLFRQGENLCKTGAYREAINPLLAAERLYEHMNPNSSEVANCHHLLGVTYYHIGNANESMRELRKAVELREAMDPHSIALSDSLHFLSLACRTQGEHEESRSLSERALWIRRRTQYLGGCLESLALLAEETMWLTRNYGKAMERIRDAEALVRNHTRQTKPFGNVLHTKGLIHVEAGEYNTAAGLLSDAINIYKEKVPRGNVDVAECFGHLALAKVWIGETNDALSILNQGQEMCRSWVSEESMAYVTLLRLEGQVRHRLGDLHVAGKCYHEGLELINAINAPTTSIDRSKIEDGLVLVETHLRRLHLFPPAFRRSAFILSGNDFKQVMLCQTGKSALVKHFVPFLHEALGSAGVDSFVDYDTLRVGNYYPTALQEQVNHCKVFIVMWSRHFPYQHWCNRELEWALNAGCTILPVYLDPSELIPSPNWILRIRMKYKFMGKFDNAVVDGWCDNIRLLDKVHRLQNQSTSRDCQVQLKARIVKEVRAALEDNTRKDYRTECQADTSHHGKRTTHCVPAPATNKSNKGCRNPIILLRRLLFAVVLFVVLTRYLLAPASCRQPGCGLRGVRRERCSKGRRSLCYDKHRLRRNQPHHW